jgi:DNA polymerase I-like protein with 3'-5' exonuclease and polymerase domains
MFRKAGIAKDDVTLLNVIQCRPPKDIFPTDKRSELGAAGQVAVTTCLKNHVLPLLQSRPWSRVILLGDRPVEWIAGKWASADKWRGSPLAVPAIDKDRPLAISTLSPEQVQKQQKLFPVVVNDLRKPIMWPKENYNLYPSVGDLRRFTATEFAFDIETSYEADANGKREIYLVALSDQTGRALVVPFTEPYMAELRRIFRDAAEVVGHNIIQFDIPQLSYHGIALNPKAQVWDTMLMQHLRFPDLPHDLEFVASQFTNKPAWKHEQASKELYAARDVDATYQIFGPLLRELETSDLIRLYKNVQVPLARICRMMTETGIKIDPARLSEVQKRIENEIEQLEKVLPESLRSYYVTKNKLEPAPEGYVDPVTHRPRKKIKRAVQEKIVPWRLDRVKKNLLYVEWGLPPQFSPKTGKLTVDKTALDKLYRRLMSPTSDLYNPERAAILKALKDINKKDHFLASFVKEERKGTARIHPEFNVHGTASGRLSSSGGEAGNFQNQPEQARYMYVPSYDDWEIAEIDYSNIENRLTALLAKDTFRLQRYDNPRHNDYKLLASRAFGIPYDEVEKDNDREAPYGKAKAIVLGCLTAEHEVLTPDGWVTMDKVSDSMPIAQWLPDGTIVFQPGQPYKAFWQGELFDVEGRAFSVRATPDHAFPAKTSGKYRRLPAEQVFATDYRIPVTGILTGGADIPDAAIQLAVALQADGTWCSQGHITFNLKRTRKIRRLRQLLTGRKYTETRLAGGYTRFYIPATELNDVKTLFLSDVNTAGTSYKRFYLPALLKLSERNRRLFLTELLQWDGSCSKNKSGRQNVYFTADLHNAEVVQALAHVTGQQALLRLVSHTSGTKRKLPLWKISFNRRKDARTASMKRTRAAFTGPVYCMMTRTGYFLVRHRNRIFVSANSNYGLGAIKTANMYDMDLQEVKDLMFAWKREIARTVNWQRDVTAQAKKQGWLGNPFGRKRWFYTEQYYTQALSFLPQSTAADIIYRAMIGLLYERIDLMPEEAQRVAPVYIPLPQPAQVLLQVHDALIIEYPRIMRDKVLTIVKQVMEQPWPELDGYRIPVNIAVGPSWGEVEPYKLQTPPEGNY